MFSHESRWSHRQDAADATSRDSDLWRRPASRADIPLDIQNETLLRSNGKEREMAPEMHRRFQQKRSTSMTTAKAYLELLQRRSPALL